ncbi:hypothetical protein HHK36_008868 [Tetracentron sinense]|uniref:Uroporphyrinogen-III cosynthase n=1 Tax=Tetracentron sinense TaxID=13715 RepID=A0A834ZND2_TETSI|nr:hypothetical protein HHK36_008868 [Tetracentron sinense]
MSGTMIQQPATNLIWTPLSNKRIAFTTPLNYAGRLAHVLELKGSIPLWCPTVVVEPTPQTRASIQFYLSRPNLNNNNNKSPLDDFSAIAFTSRTGISTFSEALIETQTQTPPLSQSGETFTISALGKDSELLNQGFISKLCDNPQRIRVLVPPIATPTGLVESLGTGLGRRVLCPVPLVVGLEEPPVVPKFLRDLTWKQWVPVRVSAYETQWAGPKCAEGLVRSEEGLDALVFTSTGEVEGLLKSLREIGFGGWGMVREKWPRLVVAAHGPVTAAGAERLGVAVDVVSSRFDSFDGVVEALALKWGWAGNYKKVAHLWGLEGAKERLQLVKADLMEEGSFDDAIMGCDGVFHTASPVLGPKSDPKAMLPFFSLDLLIGYTSLNAEILEPAVKGTLNVLRSCKKNPSLRRVVLTSSSSAVRARVDFDPNVPLDESSWSSVELCERLQIWYVLSKILAERTAWEFAKENNIDLTTILPSFVIGPSLPTNLCSTASDVLGLLQGETGKFSWHGRMGFVHIDDVALCHILVYETESAQGRYLCSSLVLDNNELASLLAKRYPSLPIPKRFECLDRPNYEFNTSKMNKLGFKFKGIEEMFDDCIASLKQQGHLL